MSATDYKPSDVLILAPAPLAGTMRKAEAEFAAALMVLACKANGDTWGAVTGAQAADAMKREKDAGTAFGQLLGNPFFRPSINELCDRGFARWIDDHGAEFTEAGFAAMRPWVKRTGGAQ